MMNYSVCIIDDDAALAKGLAMSLKNEYQTRVFFSGKTALEAMKNDPCDVILLDIGLPDMNGIEVLGKIKKHFPEIAVVMITGIDETETAVLAMKNGACDYIVKPLRLNTLKPALQNAVESIRLRKEVRVLQEKYLRENLPFFSCESMEIQDVMAFVRDVAASPDTSVLIIGESGTGKELVAGAIHYRSPNFKGPLISINCAAIPDELIESELFGYEKGAFSGASPKGKKGIIEKADKGTLFLDEIGDLSLKAQAKLLRFLESGEFYKIGGTKKIRVQTRIVSASNKNLEAMIKKKQFREDLYYRIGVIRIEVPPLNRRRGDILLIARHFLVTFAEKFGKTVTGISPDAENALKQFRWKGNIRELKNVIERAVLTAKGPELNIRNLGMKKNGASVRRHKKTQVPLIPPEGTDLSCVLQSVEKEHIKAALKISEGNERKAAKLLKMNYTTFRYRKKKLSGDV